MQLARRLHGTWIAGRKWRQYGAGLNYRLKRGNPAFRPKSVIPGRRRIEPGIDSDVQCTVWSFGPSRNDGLAAISPGNCRISSNSASAPGGAQRLGMAGPAMAAAVKAEHGHPGGDRAGDAGNAVLDDQASRWRAPHLCGREQEQVRRRLAARHLRGGENVRREPVVEAGAGEAMLGSSPACRSMPRISAADRGDRLADVGDRPQIALIEFQRGR